MMMIIIINRQWISWNNYLSIVLQIAVEIHKKEKIRFEIRHRDAFTNWSRGIK